MDIVPTIAFEPIEQLIATACQRGCASLTEPETKAILALAGVSIPSEQVVTSADAAAQAAEDIGFPVVLKVVSRDIPHKSDAGGVRLGLDSPDAVRRAYREIRASVKAKCPQASIDGMLVQPQLQGVEVILGATNDSPFGPVMVFGAGGTAVEVIGDVAFRIIPIDEHDGRGMLSEIKAAPLLDGFRGSNPVSKDSIVAALLRLSALMARFPDTIKEIEINPLLVTADRAIAVDAMAVMSGSTAVASAEAGLTAVASAKAVDGALPGIEGSRRADHEPSPVMRPGLDAFFAPRSIAVVGASASKGKAGYFLLKNILDGGYDGRVYPVNPNARRILGRKSYASVGDIPDALDLAILVVSNPQVVPVLRECAQKKVQAVAIVTAGFAEIGEQGRALQREVAEIVEQGGMRAVGPNSVGLASAPGKLVGSFVPFRKWPDGPVAIAAQTGIFTGAYIDQLAERQTQRIGFSRSICLGNTVDVDEADFVRYAAEDSATRVIALHLESFRRPRAFLAAANEANKVKPVIVLKTGRTEAGARAAASHSGALAAPARVVQAALTQYGIVQTETLEEFIGVTKAFAWQPIPRGNRVAIVTLSGALGVMAVDELHGTGLELARFAPDTVDKISGLMPEWQPVHNPADVWMALGSGPRQAHEQILGAMLCDPGVDMLLGVLLPIPNADFAEVREVFARLTRAHPDKPVFLILVGGKVKQRWLRELEPLHLPVYPDPRSAVRAMAAMRFYGERRTRVCPDPRIQQETEMTERTESHRETKERSPRLRAAAIATTKATTKTRTHETRIR